MAKAGALEYRNVTDVLVARDKKDIGLPLALFLSFLSHIALLVVLSVFKGFGPLFTVKERPKLNLGGGSPAVSWVDIQATAPRAPVVPEVVMPPPPAPEAVEIEEPAIDIPAPDAEVQFRPPDPPRDPKKDRKPEPTPVAKPPDPKLAKTAPATKGALGLVAGGAPGAGAPGTGLGGGEGPPADPGLVFYAERITSLIGEQWHQPYVTASRGTVLDCVIFFVIAKDGRVSEVSIERSSGIPNMDQSALRAVMDVGRLPPLPTTYKQPDITVSFSFRYTTGE